MSRASVKRHANDVLSLLGSRWPEVRLVAVEALMRAEIGLEPLRKALSLEPNDIVLASMCEALLVFDDRKSVPALRKLARRHTSWLVRRQAVWAVSEIISVDAVPFLKALLREERSRIVKATIKEALVKSGEYDEIASLLDMLRSRDYRIRTSIGNFFAHNILLTRERAMVARRLRAALAVENTRAAAAALRRAVKSIETKTAGRRSSE